MSQQVQELIEKIKSEGVQAAENQAAEIKQQAQAKADKIITDAKAQAQKLVNDATETIQKKEQSAKMALSQASRDTVLSLRKQIETILKNLVTKEVGAALEAGQLAGILENVIKETLKGNEKMQVALSPSDCEQLKQGLVSKFQKDVKGGFEVVSSGELNKGFAISFDEGKSEFSFTDESLSEYLSAFLNDEIAQIVKGSVK